MYAAGFPPSAIHIGQGNSWVPIYEKQPGFSDAHASLRLIDPAVPLRRRHLRIVEDELSERTPLLTATLADSLLESQRLDPVTAEIVKNFVAPRLDPQFDAAFHTTVAALNNRWRLECRQHLLLGVEIMRQNEMAAINDTHRSRLARLAEVLEVITARNDLFAAANLILDAVTIHDQESARLDRTLR
jgi:hypothetical protein